MQFADSWEIGKNSVCHDRCEQSAWWVRWSASHSVCGVKGDCLECIWAASWSLPNQRALQVERKACTVMWMFWKTWGAGRDSAWLQRKSWWARGGWWGRQVTAQQPAQESSAFLVVNTRTEGIYNQGVIWAQAGGWRWHMGTAEASLSRSLAEKCPSPARPCHCWLCSGSSTTGRGPAQGWGAELGS